MSDLIPANIKDLNDLDDDKMECNSLNSDTSTENQKKNIGCISKSKSVFNMFDNNSKRKCFGLSPISEISNTLIDTNIGTPSRKSFYRNLLRSKSAVSLNINYLDSSNNASSMLVQSLAIQKNNKKNFKVGTKKRTRNFYLKKFTSESSLLKCDSFVEETDEALKSDEEDEDEDEKQQSSESLISNNFTLNGNDETNGNINNNNNNNKYKLCNISAQRKLLNFSPIQQNYDLQSFDNISIYDEQTTTISPIRFRREHLQFSPIQDANNNNNNNNDDEEDDDDDKLISLDEFDGCSVDSGFGQFNGGHITKFKFVEPKLPTIKQQQQQHNMEPSPRKYSFNSNNNNNNINILNNNFNYNFNDNNNNTTEQISPKSFKIFHSLSSGSMESIDDEWSDLIEMESLDDEQTFPSNLTSLISGHIKSIRTTPEMKQNNNNNNENNNNNNNSYKNNNRPTVRRCLSLNENINNNLHKALLLNNNNDNNNNNNNNTLVQYNKALLPKTPDILKTVQEQKLDFTPNSSLTQRFLQQQQHHIERCFKRPEPPCFSPIKSKRYKTELKAQQQQYQEQQQQQPQQHYILQQSKSASTIEDKENNNLSLMISSPSEMAYHQIENKFQRPVFRKSISMNDADIMTALSRSSNEPELIGDFSKPFCLPLMDGKHCDLKSISSYTLAQLLHGDFKDSISTFKIIDCRYPYEYDGGHIRGAYNLYTQEQILDELVNCKTDIPIVYPIDGPKRNILVFHCEFSSERGPKLSRFLRNHDRLRNSNSYPALHYPEIYLLHGGYKEFYENFSELCDPISYRPMLEPSFGEQYRQCRAKSKSWNGDIKGSCAKYGLKKSRSRLLL